jgi:hypothetical protein
LTRARENADGARLDAPLASPTFTGSPSITLGSDATGDVYYRAAGGALTRLATGADGTVLTSTGAGAVPAFEAVPVSDIVSTATGGTTIYTEGDYKVHVYKTSSTFATGTLGGTVQYLIVAGGGGSGGWQGTGVGPNGAGGAGGVVAGSTSFSASTTYTVTVGNGGAAVTTDIPGNNGGMSQVTATDMFIRAIGGGGGGDTSTNGLDGGCGGSGGENALPFPTISSQGFKGGTTSTNACSGGGGGAGAVGVDATSTVAGNGGIGYLTTIIAHANATTEGVGQVDSSNVYFSGGGGGGKRYAGTAGTGGLGGGGNGSVDGDGNAGTNHTGGGASAGGGNATTNAKAGGHGCVILRYKFQ